VLQQAAGLQVAAPSLVRPHQAARVLQRFMHGWLWRACPLELGP